MEDVRNMPFVTASTRVLSTYAIRVIPVGGSFSGEDLFFLGLFANVAFAAFGINFQQVIAPLLYSWQLFDYNPVNHGNQLGVHHDRIRYIGSS